MEPLYLAIRDHDIVVGKIWDGMGYGLPSHTTGWDGT